MTEHLAPRQLEDYRRKLLDARSLLAAGRHLTECPECRMKLRAIAPPPAAPAFLDEMQEPLHPTYLQMCGYLDGELDEAARERLEDHASLCGNCAIELRGLQAFDAGWNPPLPETAKPDRAPQGVTAWRRIAALFEPLRQFRFALVAAACVLAGFLALSSVQVAVPRGSAARALSAAHGRFTPPAHPAVFYGGLTLLFGGLGGLLLRFWKRQ